MVRSFVIQYIIFDYEKIIIQHFWIPLKMLVRFSCHFTFILTKFMNTASNIQQCGK